MLSSPRTQWLTTRLLGSPSAGHTITEALRTSRRLSRCLSLSHLGWVGQAGGEAPVCTPPPPSPAPPVPAALLTTLRVCLVASAHFSEWEPYAVFSPSIESFNGHRSRRDMHTLRSEPYGCSGHFNLIRCSSQSLELHIQLGKQILPGVICEGSQVEASERNTTRLFLFLKMQTNVAHR